MYELDGEWHVTCRGKAAPFNLLHDYKIIFGGEGHNLIGEIDWGYFYVTPFDGGFLLNYDHDKNPECLKIIRDVVKKTKEGWSGKLFRNGKLEFAFTLTKA